VSGTEKEGHFDGIELSVVRSQIPPKAEKTDIGTPLGALTNGAAFFAQDSQLAGRVFPVNCLFRSAFRRCLVYQYPHQSQVCGLGQPAKAVVFP